MSSQNARVIPNIIIAVCNVINSGSGARKWKNARSPRARRKWEAKAERSRKVNGILLCDASGRRAC